MKSSVGRVVGQKGDGAGVISTGRDTCFTERVELWVHLHKTKLTFPSVLFPVFHGTHLRQHREGVTNMVAAHQPSSKRHFAPSHWQENWRFVSAETLIAILWQSALENRYQ